MPPEPLVPAPRQPSVPSPRRLVGGRYRLERTIGSGGMADVWSGTDEWLHRPVAIKELRLPPGITDAEAAELSERALREARALAALQHPNTILLYDIAREDRRPFVIMELVRGSSLSRLLNRHGRLGAHQLAVLADGVAAALQAAHRVGIVHRDVKPGNVLLGPRGQVKLADFGLSLDTTETLTRTGTLLGTPAFLAPEVALRGLAAPSADLWSLGATVFAAAVGRAPYDGGDPLSTIRMVVRGPVPAHHQHGAIGAVIDGLMRRDPDGRMPLTEVRRAVRELVTEAGSEPFEALLGQVTS